MDPSGEVRQLACQLMGALKAVHPKLLLQAFSKQVLFREERERENYAELSDS